MIACVSRRSLRVLFAMVRGLWILTEEWIYDSLCKGSWSDPAPYRHPRFGRHAADGEPCKIFAGKSFLICHSADPSPALMRELIDLAGGEVSCSAGSGDRDWDFLVFGRSCAL